MDDSTLISASLDGLQSLLSIARDFYFINNITANFSKYELVCSLPNSNSIIFSLTSEIPSLIGAMDLQLTPLKFSSSFRFLGVWFNLQGSPSFVISQIKDIYNSFVSTVRFKKLTSSQLAYLHSAVILPKSAFPFASNFYSGSNVITNCWFFNNDTNPYVYLCQRLISRLLAWISSISSGSVYSDWIIITFRTLQHALKWPSSLDNISDFSKWNSSRRSIHHHWIFQSLRLIFESGLNLVLSDSLCLDLMPSQSVPLVSLSVELANSEKATWLFSKFWCLTQLFDPFQQFMYTWMDLKRMNLVSKTGKTPSCTPALYPPSLLTLQGTALDTIDEQSRIKARNRYYWIAGLDGSDTMIFGRVFYTVDVHGTRIVYFSHWITSSSDRFKISPCQGCSLHDASIENGPLQVRSVGSKLSHRSCLTFLPSYRCLHLFHMSSRIDSTCNNINLFLSPFLLCSFFKILLGYSCIRIPELFLVDSSSPSLPTNAIVFPKLPDVLSNFDPDLRINTEQHLYLHAKSSIPKPVSSNDIICGWVQRDDDLILSSGTFS
ncbi:unnamed protein product [Rhizophagus irregularis]|nr:unnamed protein product [Rhizophagus irregularis]